MKAIAIDDEPIALNIVASHASKVPFLHLKGLFTDAFKALDFLQQEEVDLIFLDIKMPDISGIEFFRSLRKKPLLIFTTAYSEHAVAGFELDAVDYLLKPFSLTRFLQACNKANELFTARNSTSGADHLFIKTGYEQVKLRYADIIYIEAAGNYVKFILQDKPLLSRSTFAEVEALMPSDKFIRVHRSYIVAIDKIDKIEKGQLTVGKLQVPVGEAYRQNLGSITRAGNT
jgi:DNA-binding LytR/AlgR family response regulator